MTRAASWGRGVFLVVALVLAGCSSERRGSAAPGAAPLTAVGELRSVHGSAVHGSVTFTFDQGGLRITGEVEGLTPGSHALTVFAALDCSVADSLRPTHFNPTEQPHGDPDLNQRHLGDLGNLVADRSGRARYDRLDRSLTLQGPEALVGHALGVHMKPNDREVQPDGAAGPIVACGVITLR